MSTATAATINRTLANRDGAIVPLIAETGGVNAMIVDATALPEQVMDAGLTFDPFDPVAIADAIARLFIDDDLCEELRTNARRRLNNFDWVRTARAYRAIYRRTAGQQLSEDDRMLLEWDWMRDPPRVVAP